MAISTHRELFEPERLLAFSDGVFAVAITLLVIDLRLPQREGGDEVNPDVLLAMGPKLLIFAFTFIIIGMSWLGPGRSPRFHRLNRSCSGRCARSRSSGTSGDDGAADQHQGLVVEHHNSQICFLRWLSALCRAAPLWTADKQRLLSR